MNFIAFGFGVGSISAIFGMAKSESTAKTPNSIQLRLECF
jgi:hypothetical protein